MLSPLPPEVIYEIALHLPHTTDVIALSLTSHAIRGAISTPALFKARLLLQGWDIDAWQDEDDKAQGSVDWKRWIRIDYIHSKTLQLLEDASSPGGLSKGISDPESSGRFRTYQPRNALINYRKAETWSRRLSKVFPILIAHHRVNNILHITKPKYGAALRAYVLMATEIYVDLQSHWYKGYIYPDRTSVILQERACFGLAALVMQCNAKTFESVFGNDWTAEGYGLYLNILSTQAISQWRTPNIGGSGVLPDILGISMQYGVGFLTQAKLRLELHHEAARRPLSLLPPSIPPMDLASQYNGPFELDSADISWPWLRDGLAGTPIARLSYASGDRWAGYYTSVDMELRDPPMFFKFRLVPTPAVNGEARRVYFLGEGADSGGSFLLEGSADTHTGVVSAKKTYVGAHWWDWNGLITPFGMVGVWSLESGAYNRWWWIWPEEWSERSPASLAG